MAQRINPIGSTPRRVQVVDTPKRALEPAEIAEALGANAKERAVPVSGDMVELAELGTQLLRQLKSTGGRPALSDATEICRVPLRKSDVKLLERICNRMRQLRVAKPSVGHLVSVIV